MKKQRKNRRTERARNRTGSCGRSYLGLDSDANRRSQQIELAHRYHKKGVRDERTGLEVGDFVGCLWEKGQPTDGFATQPKKITNLQRSFCNNKSQRRLDSDGNKIAIKFPPTTQCTRRAQNRTGSCGRSYLGLDSDANRRFQQIELAHWHHNKRRSPRRTDRTRSWRLRWQWYAYASISNDIMLTSMPVHS